MKIQVTEDKSLALVNRCTCSIWLHAWSTMEDVIVPVTWQVLGNILLVICQAECSMPAQAGIINGLSQT